MNILLWAQCQQRQKWYPIRSETLKKHHTPYLGLAHNLSGPYKKKMLNCNLFTHEALKISWELVQRCTCILNRIGIWKCWFLRRGENQGSHRKNLSEERRKLLKTTNPTHIQHWCQNLNPGHAGGRQVLSIFICCWASSQKATVKQGNKNVQLVLQHCCKMNWKVMFCV